MMDALVSGSAARAVFIEGTTVHFIEADDPQNIKTSSPSAIPKLLEGATDVVRMRVKNFTDTYPVLLANWQKDRALRMLQIIFAADDDDDLVEAADYLNDLLGAESIGEHVENVTYAVPHEGGVSSSQLNSIDRFPLAHALVSRLIEDQPFIRIVRTEFEKIRFTSANDKYEYEQRAVSGAVFPRIAAAIAGRVTSDDAVLQCLKAFAGLPDARQTVQFWTSTLLDKTARKAFKRFDVVEDDDDHDERNEFETRDRKALFDAVQTQKAAIVRKLGERDFGAARRFAAQLVESQLQNGGEEYASKSLSSLATAARHMGLHEIELEWAARAVEVKSEDPWARALLGDTYLSLYRFQEAQIEFHAAIAFGEIAYGTIGLARVLRASGRLDKALEAFSEARAALANTDSAAAAWVGYCETLRDMWRLEDALSAFREAQAVFPDERWFWLGEASVLKDFGQLNESASAYSDVIRRWPEEAVAYCGRADAFKRKGDFELAINLYSETKRLFPYTAFAHTGLADVFRSSGDLKTALVLYREAKESFAFEPSAFNGYADTLRDDGDFDGAIVAYREAIEKFPLEPRARNGLANALKLANDLTGALQAFDANIKDFPYDLYSLSGRANLLKLLGNYAEALSAYDLIIDRRPEFLSALASKASVLLAMGRLSDASKLLPGSAPCSEHDWVFYHVRGMFELRSGNLQEAIRIFRDGLNRSPYFRARNSFRTALALAEIKAKHFEEATQLLDGASEPLQAIIRSIGFVLSGDRYRARGVISAVNDNVPPQLLTLKIEMLARVDNSATRSDEWFIEASEEAVLQLAA